jgi:hypothetical protein
MTFLVFMNLFLFIFMSLIVIKSTLNDDYWLQASGEAFCTGKDRLGS